LELQLENLEENWRDMPPELVAPSEEVDAFLESQREMLRRQIEVERLREIPCDLR
jgi:hypothetical protein